MSYPPLIDLRIGFWPVVHFIRPCSLFPIDNLSIYAQNFFKFCIHIVIGYEWYGIVNGQNPTIFDAVTALSPFKKWFLACFSFTVYDIWMKLHRYVEQQRLHITTKDRHSYLSSSWVICPWLILSISVLLLFRHYISHKITFGAPSSGGVLCSACGAFIFSVLTVTWLAYVLTKNRIFMNKSHVDIKCTFYLDVRNVRRQILTSFVRGVLMIQHRFYKNPLKLLTFDIMDFAEGDQGN